MKLRARTSTVDTPGGTLRAGMALRGGGMLASKASAFLATLLIARTLPSADAGGFFFSLSLGTVLGLVLALGVAETVSREVPRLDARGRSHDVGALLTGSVQLVMAAAVVGSLIVALLLRFVDPGRRGFVVAAAALGVTLAFQSLGAGFLRARNRFALAEASQAMAPTLFLIALVPALFWFRSADSIVLGLRVSLELVAAGLAVGCALALSRTGRGSTGRPGVASMLTLSTPLWVTGLCWLVIQQSDIVALGFMRGPSAVGVYAPILKIAEASTLLLAAVAPYLLPESARLDARGDHTRLQALYDSSSKWVLVFGAPLLAALVLAPRELVHVLMGIENPAVATVCRLLATAFALMALFGASEALLQANCRPGRLVRRSLFLLVGTVTINVLLVWRFGVVGAAVGNLLACGLFCAANAWLLHAELRVRPFSSELGRVLGVAIISTGITAILLTRIDGQLISIAIASMCVATPTLVAAIGPDRWTNAKVILSTEPERA